MIHYPTKQLSFYSVMKKHEYTLKNLEKNSTWSSIPLDNESQNPIRYFRGYIQNIYIYFWNLDDTCYIIEIKSNNKCSWRWHSNQQVGGAAWLTEYRFLRNFPENWNTSFGLSPPTIESSTLDNASDITYERMTNHNPFLILWRAL